jgi:hypothetical protein
MFAQAALCETKITIESEPAGARLCQRERGGITCFARTPCEVPAASHTKKYYLQKVGYKRASVSVKESDKNIRVPLEKIDVFEHDSPDNDPKHRQLQTQVVRLLSDRLYGNAGGINDTGFVLYSQAGVQKLPDGYFVEIGIMLDDEFRQTRLRSIRRIQNHDDRVEALVRNMLDYTVDRFMTELRDTLITIQGLKGISLIVFYAKSDAALVEDSEKFILHQISRWEQGNTKFERHTYQHIDVIRSKVEDVKEVHAVILKIAFQDILNDPTERRDKVVTAAEIYSDDNPDKKMERFLPR